jgi:hypothetical protein
METVDQIYEKLAKAIIDSITKPDWHKAELHLEVIGSSVDFKGYLNENERLNAPGGFSLAKSVLNLHSITSLGGNNTWNRAIFTLTPDGEFNMEFIWDQDLQDEVERLAKS